MRGARHALAAIRAILFGHSGDLHTRVSIRRTGRSDLSASVAEAHRAVGTNRGICRTLQQLLTTLSISTLPRFVAPLARVCHDQTLVRARHLLAGLVRCSI